jgi:hypothetical protein
MRLFIHHIYAKLWARRRGYKYAKIHGMDKGIMELPSGQRFSFTLAAPEGRKLPLLGLPAFTRQLQYQARNAKALPR